MDLINNIDKHLKHRFLGKSYRDRVSFFKYSDVNSFLDNENPYVYHYPYDNLTQQDISDARIILFSGRSGHGKTTAINAFFNIIKGINLEDTFRYILIEEEKKPEGQAVSQTAGVHLYYLRDKLNKPIIIIDSQGFGDTRGFENDKRLNQIFQYLFSHVIDHINSICFIVMSLDTRLHPITKYIIQSVTGLFAEDVCKNFFVLSTHANDDCFLGFPPIIEILKNNEPFHDLIPKMRKKWYYAFDSKKILEDNRIIEDAINVNSYHELKTFFLEAVNNSPPISIKNTADVLERRNLITLDINKLKNSFQDIMKEQKNLKLKQEFFEKKEHQIEMINEKIENTKITLRNTDPEEQKKRLREIFNDIQDLRNGKIDQIKIELEEADKEYTYCNTCKKNCHNPCNCWFTSFTRCKIFKIKGCLGILQEENLCEKCGCGKSKHRMSKHHYVSKIQQVSANKDDKYDNIKSYISKNDNNNVELYNNAKDSLDNLEQQKTEVEKEKEDLIKEKIDIENKMKEVKKNIIKIVLELQQSSNIIQTRGLNKNHARAEFDYINELEHYLEANGDNEYERIKNIKEIKELFELFMKYKNINVRDLENMNMDDLIQDIDEFLNSQNNL